MCVCACARARERERERERGGLHISCRCLYIVTVLQLLLVKRALSSLHVNVGLHWNRAYVISPH